MLWIEYLYYPICLYNTTLIETWWQSYITWHQAAIALYMKSLLSWDVMRQSKQFLDCLTLEDWADGLSLNVGN